jgi:hypothetical protein
MAWEISMSSEGWGELYETLHNPELTSKKTLAKGLGDYNYEKFHGYHSVKANPYHKGFWSWKKFMKLPHDVLADTVYNCIEEINTCNNGGNGFWVDPEGYNRIYI